MHITELKAEAKRQTLISVTVFDTFLAHKSEKLAFDDLVDLVLPISYYSSRLSLNLVKMF